MRRHSAGTARTSSRRRETRFATPATTGSSFRTRRRSSCRSLSMRRPGERTLDLCAAPGGKTVMMSGDMADSGVLVACDVRARRVALLRDTIRQAGCHHAHPVHVPTDGSTSLRRARSIACSSTRRARGWARCGATRTSSGAGTKHDLAGLAERQLALLQRAAAVVRPGGRLVYATCSSEPEENEMVVDRFLASAAWVPPRRSATRRPRGACARARRSRDAPHAAVRARPRSLLAPPSARGLTCRVFSEGEARALRT